MAESAIEKKLRTVLRQDEFKKLVADIFEQIFASKTIDWEREDCDLGKVTCAGCFPDYIGKVSVKIGDVSDCITIYLYCWFDLDKKTHVALALFRRAGCNTGYKTIKLDSLVADGEERLAGLYESLSGVKLPKKLP